MLNQLNYEATQLGAGHVLHTSSSWGLSMPFVPGMSYATLVGVGYRAVGSRAAAERLAQLLSCAGGRGIKTPAGPTHRVFK